MRYFFVVLFLMIVGCSDPDRTKKIEGLCDTVTNETWRSQKWGVDSKEVCERFSVKFTAYSELILP